MSIVQAYRCDVCFVIKTESEIVGILATEDIFDRMLSFPTTLKSYCTKIHFCLECYDKKVIRVAQRFVYKKKQYEILTIPIKQKQHCNVWKFEKINFRERIDNVKKSEYEHKNKVKELSYDLRAKAVYNWRNKIFKEET